MDIQTIVMQGGALGVVLVCFLWLLQFLLNNFTRALSRIEKAQHATTLAAVGVTKMLFRATIHPDQLIDQQVKQHIDETIDMMKQIESLLLELKEDGMRKR